MNFLMVAIFIFIIHYIGDWLLQSRKVADNKSKSLNMLLYHANIYCLTLFVGSLLWCISWDIILGNGYFSIFCPVFIWWSEVNMIFHTIQDKITSRYTSRFYRRKDYKKFFDIIGLDSMLHYITLFVTYQLIIGF